MLNFLPCTTFTFVCFIMDLLVEEDFYLFKSFSATLNPQASLTPTLVSPGVQLEQKHPNQFFVREVLDGLPARLTGLKKGDQIVDALRRY